MWIEVNLYHVLSWVENPRFVYRYIDLLQENNLENGRSQKSNDFQIINGA